MRKIKEMWAVLLVIVLLILVTGQEGCPGPSEQQGKSGMGFTLIQGVSLLTPPKTLEKNEAFMLGVHVENYNDEDDEGMVCVRDNVADSFAGIPSEGDGDCQSFSVRAAEQTGDDEQVPGTTNLYFPSTQNQYMYTGFPELNAPYDATVFVSMKYRQDSQATATITTPDETQPTITQDSQPVRVQVTKSIFLTGDNYRINLEFHLFNTQNVGIYSPDFVEQDKIYFNAEMQPLSLHCTDVNNNPITGLLEFENEKIIKCYALTASRTQQSYPLVVTLDYGVSIDKEYRFGIKTK
jgi:hypothetical protein